MITASPLPRVVAFNLLGEPSLLLQDEHRYAGVRTWFMEPGQVRHSASPSNRAGRFLEVEPLRAVVEGGADQTTQFQVVMEVALDPNEAALTIRHGVRNLSRERRTLAAWGIISVARRGSIELTTDAPDHAGRTIVYFDDVSPTDPAIRYDAGSLTIRVADVADHTLKLGSASRRGLATWRSDETPTAPVLIAQAPRVEGLYPEGGANVTVFVSKRSHRYQWAELEHVGPLIAVGPGEVIWLEQSLRIQASDDQRP